MKTNLELLNDVRNALAWEPSLDTAEIGVTAKDGIITLTGTVDSYFKKAGAENAAKSVAGVYAVVEKIEVDFNESLRKSDSEIADTVLNAYNWNREIPKGNISVTVESGWVTLDGNVDWHYQRETAEKMIQYLDGVKGISNNISIKSAIPREINLKQIEKALSRNGHIYEEDINVSVSGSTVTLNGTVESHREKDTAERMAWNAPGVEHVDNQILVENEYELVD